MKLTVLLVTFYILTVAHANSNDPSQIEKYGENVKTYKLEVPGKQPITIIESASATDSSDRWEEIEVDPVDKEDNEVKNLMTHIIHDHVDGHKPRCYGPSCQDGFNPEEGPQKEMEDFDLDAEKLKYYPEFTKDRLEAITALAAKLKKEKLKADRYTSSSTESNEDEGNAKVYTSWNKLKVKQHKHPFDDKDGWVSLEPVAWSTSKISKWKPNNKKHKPNHWNDDQDRFPSDDQFNPYQSSSNSYNYAQNKPAMNRPQFINNKLHVPQIQVHDLSDSELPSKPSWARPPQSSFASNWSPDDSRRPYKPNCDSNNHMNSNAQDSYAGDDDTVFYGISDSVMTDHRPSHFPGDYEALHQAAVQRPYRRPTQVVYAGMSDYEGDRSSRPPHGDGQWVLLSTTKGYRNKKRQRSLNPASNEDKSDQPQSVTSHQAVSLTVLPVDDAHTNMTTSHGGILEVEKSFQTVEESKRDMDKQQDLATSASHHLHSQHSHRPAYKVKRKLMSNAAPDSSTVLAAVGAGMVPATMAMVVPLMLGRRRRRDVSQPLHEDILNMHNIYYRYQ